MFVIIWLLSFEVCMYYFYFTLDSIQQSVYACVQNFSLERHPNLDAFFK